MLTVPAYSEIEGVTIYGDDALFYKFYPVPQAPGIRLDKDGKPVFLLVKYSFSDDERSRDSSLPPGGGYLNFDVDFSIPDDLLGIVRQQLQPQVNQEWERLRNGTGEERAQVASMAQSPTVEFGTPTFTDGSVTMNAPDAPELVTGIVTEGAPSLLAGNIAVFNLDLSSAGATFMERVLVSPEGQGATNLTPIQVRYDLKFWARLPPVTIKVKANSEKIYNYIRSDMEGRGRYYCLNYYFRPFDTNSETDTSTASIMSQVDVEIDTGSGSLPDDVIEELREYSLELVKEMVESSFFTDERPDRPEERDEDEQRRSEYPDYYPYYGNTKRYLRQTYDSSTMSIEFNLEQRSVIDWKIRPQSTLQTFFKGMSDDQLKQFVRLIRLDDDFFKNLNLTVNAYADFEDEIVDFVEIQVRYEGTDENGERVEKGETFTFTSDEPQVWMPQLINGKRDYQYRHRIHYRGQEPLLYSDWSAPQSTPDLNIPLADAGRIKIVVMAQDVNFTEVENVQVRIRYEDQDQNIPKEEVVLPLTATVTERHYERLIYKPMKKKAQYQTRFKMKSGDVHEDTTWHDVIGPQILVNEPNEDILRVSLLPSGNGWDDIIQVIVDLYYEDIGNQFSTDGTVVLRSSQDTKTWQVPLRDKNQRSFQYRTNISYKKGTFEQSDWQMVTPKAKEPPTVTVMVNKNGYRVTLKSEMLDFAACPITEVTTRYEANNFKTQKTFIFSKKEDQFWDINVPKGDYPLEYFYRVTHYPNGQSPVIQPEMWKTGEIIVLPAYQPSKPDTVSIPVHGNLVDYLVTPIVMVDLYYDDDQNQIHETLSMTFTERGKQTWTVDAKDLNPKGFGYMITYYTVDGHPHPQAKQYPNALSVVIPKIIS